jgi:hypothetical protein
MKLNKIASALVTHAVETLKSSDNVTVMIVLIQGQEVMRPEATSSNTATNSYISNSRDSRDTTNGATIGKARNQANQGISVGGSITFGKSLYDDLDLPLDDFSIAVDNSSTSSQSKGLTGHGQSSYGSGPSGRHGGYTGFSQNSSIESSRNGFSDNSSNAGHYQSTSLSTSSFSSISRATSTYSDNVTHQKPPSKTAVAATEEDDDLMDFLKDDSNFRT